MLMNTQRFCFLESFRLTIPDTNLKSQLKNVKKSGRTAKKNLTVQSSDILQCTRPWKIRFLGL